MAISKPKYAILTPLAVEYEAVRAHISHEVAPKSQTLPTTIGKIADHEVVCVLSGKGEANTAASFQYVSQTWNPRWIFLIGIAGGLRDVRRGDVLIANFVYYLDFGKVTGGKYIRRPEYDFAPDRSLLAYAELVVERTNDTWIDRIKTVRPGGRSNQDPRAVVGYLASGNKVIDDPSQPLFQAAAQTIPELYGIEMEASGAGASLRLEQSRRAIGVLMIRGISDVPTENTKKKTGSSQRQLWKAYASAAAAAFLDATLSIIPSSNLELEIPSKRKLEGAEKEGLSTSGKAAFLPEVSLQQRAPETDYLLTNPDGIQYARVLVPLEAERLFVATSPAKHEVYSDPSAIIHISEELLAFGCLQLAIPNAAPFAQVIEKLPQGLRNRVKTIDDQMEEAKRATAFFQPIADELNIPVTDLRPKWGLLPPLGNSLVNEKNSAKKRKIALLSQLFEGTYSLFLALRYKLQIDIDIKALAEAAAALRGELRDSAARTNLASLSGLLRSYKAWEIKTIELVLEGRHDRVDPFDYFWRNPAFRHLSHQQYLIGIPQQTEGALRTIERLSNDLIHDTNDLLQNVPRAQTLQASVGIPDPLSQLEHEANVNGFFPPIIPLRGLMWRASKNWGRQLPEGLRLTRFKFEGLPEYLPEMPPMVVTDSSKLRFSVASMVGIGKSSDLAYIQAVLTDGLTPCQKHLTVPRFDFVRTLSGKFEVTYHFCCNEQKDKLLKEHWKAHSRTRKKKT
jgi:nucleoside phosphorylase